MRKMLFSWIGWLASILTMPDVPKCTILPWRWSNVMMPGRRLSLTQASIAGPRRCRRWEDMPASSARVVCIAFRSFSWSNRRGGRTGCSATHRFARFDRCARGSTQRVVRERADAALPRRPPTPVGTMRDLASLLPERSCASDQRSRECGKINLDVWGRNCDRAVERSPAFEARHQVGALLGGDAAELQMDAHRVEQIDVLAHGRTRIRGRLDGRVDRPQRHLELFGQHLNQLDAARRHA